MKILIFSDSHGNDANMFRILNKEKNVDMVLHAGDIEGSEEELTEKSGVETHIVRGNCDWFCDLKAEKTINALEHRIFLRHGDGYVNYNPESLLELTDADIIIFGHTHVPYYKVVNGRHLFNPGSISRPRTAERKASYGVLEIGKRGVVEFRHEYL